MEARRRGILMASQFEAAVDDEHAWLKFAISSDDKPYIWYVLLSGFSGDDNEFEGGEYLVRMEAPEKFPYEPPSFYFMTPNGVYGVETKVCIHIGEYHKADYRAALGMRGFAEQLVSGMIGWKSLGGGISILSTKNEEKKKLAKASREYNNKNFPKVMKMIQDSYDHYTSSRPARKAEKAAKEAARLAKLNAAKPAAKPVAKQAAKPAANVVTEKPVSATTSSSQPKTSEPTTPSVPTTCREEALATQTKSVPVTPTTTATKSAPATLTDDDINSLVAEIGDLTV